MFKKFKNNKILKSILKLIEWLLFLVIVIVFFVSLSPLLPFKNVPKTYVVTTGSMVPTIQPGSIALVLPKTAKDINTNDIVAFSSPEDSSMTIIHRIVNIKSKEPFTFESKGDNNNATDVWEIHSSNIIGKYLFSVPLLGNLVAFLKQPLGFALIVVIPALFFIIIQLKNIKTGIEEEVTRRLEKVQKENDKKSETDILKSILLLITLTSMFSIVSTEKAVALFVDNVAIYDISLYVKDFAPPKIPSLIYPLDKAILNTSGLVMDWSTESDYEHMNDPVYYIYQSARNENFSPLAYESKKLSDSKIPAPGTPNGKYWWRVKACDALDNCSDWSDVWTVTIDNTAPVVNITNIDEDEKFWNKVEIKGSITDANSYTYSLVIKDKDGHKIVNKDDIEENTSFTNKLLYTWDVSSIAEGLYEISLEAKDIANNFDISKSNDKVTIEVARHLDVDIDSPKKDEEYELDTTMEIKWDVDKVDDSSDLIIDVYVSLDGGTTFTKIEDNLKNVSSYSWDIPDDDSFKSSTVVIKVSVEDEHGFSGSSKSDVFSIKDND